MVDLPRRPRLARHVLARRYIRDGEEQIILLDTRSAALVQIGRVEWVLLAGADGTRDLEGVRAAALREGAALSEANVEAFFAQLQSAGMLADGLERPPRGERVDDAARPLEVLPDFSLHCDGSGSCCRFYASMIFGPVEATRARGLLPLVLDGAYRHEHVFLPEHGTGLTGGAAVTVVDGRCAYLGAAGRCEIHAAGGAAAKPVGCQLYPATFVDDGERLRVSVAVECACVLASVGRPGGAPIVPEGARVRGDLDEAVGISRLPEYVPITDRALASCAEYVAWSNRVAARLPFRDGIAALLGLADAIEAQGIAADPADFPAPSPDAIRPWIEALALRAARRADQDATWRSARDLARRAVVWITATAQILLEPGVIEAILEAPVPSPEAEHFYLRANLHGLRFAGDLALSHALRDRAVRLLVGRALPLVLSELPVEELDPACAEPLALVEATLRGHGLDAYAYDVAGHLSR